jgi:exopolysaccharide production protein ExoZ
MTNRSIRFIQVFRGIAALLVVLWHASRYVGPYGTGTGAMLFQAGASMGVDLFFLISGFIMVYTTASNDGSFHYLMDFFVKRLTRIWPVWAIALIIYIAAKWDLSYLTDIPKLKWFLHSLAFIPTGGVSGDIAPVFGFPILGVGWTLNYEMYFYLFFGACMLFGRWRWPAMVVWLLITLIGIPYVTGRLGSIGGWQAWLSPNTDYHYRPRYISLITNPLILMFAIGAAIAKIYQSSFVIESRFYLHLAMFLALALVIWQYMYPLRTDHGVLQWGLSLILLMSVFCIASKRIEIPAPSWLVYLGDISFSLYLLHGTVQESFDRLANIPGLGRISTGYSAILLSTAISIAVAALAHRYIERGLCEYLKRISLPLLDFRRKPRGALRTVTS